jgi:hypothetical protein
MDWPTVVTIQAVPFFFWVGVLFGILLSILFQGMWSLIVRFYKWTVASNKEIR